MIPTIIVNGLTTVHQKSDGIATCSAPDFYKTPGAGVMPYVNVGFSKDLVKGSRTVTTDGVPGALKDSEFTPSIGDEPGVGGGSSPASTRAGPSSRTAAPTSSSRAATSPACRTL